MARIAGGDAQCNGVERGVARRGDLQYPHVIYRPQRGVEIRVLPESPQFRVTDVVAISGILHVDGIANRGNAATAVSLSPVASSGMNQLR